MAAPDYVPVPRSERPRTPLAMPPSRRWTADRPGDLTRGQPTGPNVGRPGPDQGYALRLAQDMSRRIRVTEGESHEDAVAGCMAVAMRRASMFGRAPVTHDVELAFRLWGFFEGAPPGVVEFRKAVFAGVAHHYWVQRHIADMVPESTLRLTPSQVADRLEDWRELLGLDAG